ncbi:MAG: BON domain-containing protein [Pyrinomonadaceae bacterium MAG19_C2-C3]|nr:BON domain-containing protein [Pyrinomonadaceae bacterium MAG19_C2-C3]
MTDTKLKALLVLTLTCSLFASACTQNDTSSTANTQGNTATVNPTSAINTDVPSTPPLTATAPAATPVVITAKPDNATSMTTDSSATSQSPTPKTSGTPPPATVSSSGAQDFFVFSAARGALNDDAELKNENITVDVKNGVVTLTGSVTDEAKKTRAAQLAGQAKDAKGIKNLLKIAPVK